MKEIADRVVRREGLSVSPPKHLVGAKKLKRLMEKVEDKREDLRDYDSWPGRSRAYFKQSQAFCILDTVRLSFTCNGESTAEQVDCCMHLFDEFSRCTVE